jgi:hypothetical protein
VVRELRRSMDWVWEVAVTKTNLPRKWAGGPTMRVSMKIVAWNCRVLGNRPTVRGLLGLQKSEGVDILFLLETKLDKLMMVRFQWMLGLPNTLVQKGDGKGGRLLCFGREESMYHCVACHNTISMLM